MEWNKVENKVKVIKAEEIHIGKLATMAVDLWPEEKFEVHRQFILSNLDLEDHVYFLATVEDKIAGFIYMSIRRDYVEGASSSPVGYVEGIYVKPAYRHKGIGRLLVTKGEEWAKSKGCREIASDILYHNTDSYNFHSKVGFREANRLICFIKDID